MNPSDLLNQQHAANSLGGLNSANQYQQGQASYNQYDPNPQLTKAINRLAKAIEDMKPRFRVKMGRAVV